MWQVRKDLITKLLAKTLDILGKEVHNMLKS